MSERAPDEIVERVRAHYAELAIAATPGSDAGCGCGCGSSLYPAEELRDVPDAAVAASAGCMNPVAVAELAPGDVVLDLGSGGGIDVLLSAKRVAPGGKVIGLDMTDEMLALARENMRRAGVDNAEFLKGRIEAIPLPDSSVDVILSNCVINLSPQKDRVFREAYRVLRAGGRLAVADVVADSERARELADQESWEACIAGALTRDDYAAGLAGAGFTEVSMEHSHAVAPGHSSVLVRATKPAATTP